MKPGTIFGLVLGAAGLAVAAGPAFAVQGVTANEIVLGTHQPLSGPASAWGLSVANGLRMRVEEINEAGGINGRKIRLVVEDNQYIPAKAAQVGNKLLKRDKVFAIVGALGTPPNMVVMPLAFKRGVPNVFPFSGGRQMYEPFNRLKFSFVTPYYDQMRAAVKYFAETKGKKNICAMYVDSDYGREVFEGVRAQVEAMGLKLVATTTHKPTTKDFGAQITKLRAAGCDLVTLGSIVADTIIPVATARKLGWGVDFVVSAAGFTTETITAAPKGATEGLYAMGQFEFPYEDTAKPVVRAWIQRYREKFGKEPTIQAAGAYSAMDMFTYALQKAGRKLTVDSLIEALEGIKGWRDIFDGPIQSFGPKKRLGTRQTSLYQVKDGRWVRISGFLTY